MESQYYITLLAYSLPFLGQTLKSSYILRKNYKQEANWQNVENIVTTHADLEQEVFNSSIKYNAIGEVIEKTDSQNNTHSPIYDVAGRVKQINLKKQGENIKTYVSDISYNPKGQRTSISYGNGVVTSYSYDPKTFQLTKLTSQKEQKKLQSINYTYDPVVNITTMEDESYKTIFPNNKSIDTKSDYHYDSLYRLTQATGKEHPALSGKEEIITPIPHLNNQNAISNYTEYYDFDYGSNITKIRHSGKNNSTKEFYISSKSNRSLPIIESRPVNENDIDASYDERGNLLKLSGTQNLRWNYRDNIAYVDIITRPSGKNDSEYYVYDSSGQRVRKVTETYQNNEANHTKVEKIYFGDIEVTRIYQESGLSKEKYTVHVMDDKSRVALHHYWTKGTSDETRESQSRYQLSNHLDSVALELNDNAEIMTYEEYLPFGGTALIAGKTAREVSEKEYRYSGKERDESTGLYYYRARYYAPWLLRWINPDPAGTVDGFNLYLFVKGNPVNSVDIGGMCSSDEHDLRYSNLSSEEGSEYVPSNSDAESDSGYGSGEEEPDLDTGSDDNNHPNLILLGAGNLSEAVSRINTELVDRRRLVVTTYESEAELTRLYGDGYTRNRNALNDMGVTVIHNVDVNDNNSIQQLRPYLNEGSSIHFQMPRVSRGDSTQRLIGNTFVIPQRLGIENSNLRVRVTVPDPSAYEGRPTQSADTIHRRIYGLVRNDDRSRSALSRAVAEWNIINDDLSISSGTDSDTDMLREGGYEHVQTTVNNTANAAQDRLRRYTLRIANDNNQNNNRNVRRRYG